MIGRYKLLEQIGEGGMGVVHMAEQRLPVTRRVALKVIKPGVDTGDIIARFESERRALAMMNHQNVVRLLDTGATTSGHPYLVMELIDGVRLTDFCDQNRLDTRTRLVLFTSVCHAVQYIHQKGIIHCDIKPSNVLVALQDHVPIPKVIDFGIAKTIEQPLPGERAFAQCDQLIGTPLYMSPEQAERSRLDIDTRSDIYSLGVLLYELLTGGTPIDRSHLEPPRGDKISSIIRGTPLIRPSDKITTLDKARETVLDQRSTAQSELARTLRGQLDWIVMRALEKDRWRRYDTSAAFAGDVQRYLNNQPVRAYPRQRPSWYDNRP